MKRCLYILLLFIGVNASAQENKLLVYFTPGYSAPTSPDFVTDTYKNGVSLGLGMNYKVARNVSMRLSFRYSTWRVDEEWLQQKYNLKIDVRKGAFSIITGMLDAILYLPSFKNIKPYAAGGIGLINVTPDENMIVFYCGYYFGSWWAIKPQTRLGANLGLGVNMINDSGLVYTLECSYSVGFIKKGNIAFFEIRAGIGIPF